MVRKDNKVRAFLNVYIAVFRLLQKGVGIRQSCKYHDGLMTLMVLIGVADVAIGDIDKSAKGSQSL